MDRGHRGLFWQEHCTLTSFPSMEVDGKRCNKLKCLANIKKKKRQPKVKLVKWADPCLSSPNACAKEIAWLSKPTSLQLAAVMLGFPPKLFHTPLLPSGWKGGVTPQDNPPDTPGLGGSDPLSPTQATVTEAVSPPTPLPLSSIQLAFQHALKTSLQGATATDDSPNVTTPFPPPSP
jgi:hypothetical protein